MALLTLRLLGPFILEHASSQVELKRAKARALLAWLACNPQSHTRLHLASLLWPEVEEARGLASLRNTVWELQRLLGEGWLQADRTSLQLATSPEVWVDVHHFQRLLREAQASGRTPSGESVDALAQAVALYRGRLLEGLTLPDCAAFSEWQSQATEQHHLQATQALERLTSALILQGRLEEALPHAQRLVALEPTHEEAHRQLIRLYAWLERWADALRQHRHCVDMLRTGLDSPPQAETQRLLEQLQARSVPPPPRGSSAPAPELAPPPHSHALPAPVTALRGRTAELQLVLQRLEDPACQLLTLTGPGGVGKTTLALEAARRHAHRHGVCFVPLAAVDDPERLPSVLLEALELPASHAPPLTRLREHLRSRDMLLVLDNFEHLLPAAPLLAELLTHAPSLKLLVTSRERLNLRREWLLSLDGLPPREALELFTLLASRAEASFHLTPENEGAVARLCQIVEGSPLGLELAAAWVPFFPPSELVARLERDTSLLSAPRDAPERHQSLHATFLHSWRLLSPEEQGVLRRLSVFRDSASLEAAMSVAGARIATLTSLAHKSLLRRTASGRVELHGLLHQYAEQELRAVPQEYEHTHHRHAEFFLSSALGPLGPRPPRGHQAEAVAELEADQEELRAAFHWASSHGRWELIAQALEAYGLAQELRGRFQEAATLLGEAVAALRPVAGPGATHPLRLLLGRLLAWQARFALGGTALSPGAALALVEEGLLLLGEQGAQAEVTAALLTAGRLALQQGRVPTARWSFHGSLSLAQAANNRRAIALAMSELSEVASLRGRPGQARRMLARSLAAFRALGEERHVATCLSRMAALLLARGELDKAASALREGLELLQAGGLRLHAAPLRAQLAEVLLQRGALEEARHSLEANLHLGRTLGHPETVAQALQGLGMVATREGQGHRARALLEEALALHNQLGARRAAAESLEALGRLALAEADTSRARGCLQAALKAAMEVNSPSLLLDILVTLAELPTPSGDRERPHRALSAIAAHPLTSRATRLRATALLPPEATSTPSPQRPLPEVVADVLAAVGMA